VRDTLETTRITRVRGCLPARVDVLGRTFGSARHCCIDATNRWLSEPVQNVHAITGELSEPVQHLHAYHDGMATAHSETAYGSCGVHEE
jgi:hypothetical protein